MKIMPQSPARAVKLTSTLRGKPSNPAVPSAAEIDAAGATYERGRDLSAKADKLKLDAKATIERLVSHLDAGLPKRLVRGTLMEVGFIKSSSPKVNQEAAAKHLSKRLYDQCFETIRSFSEDRFADLVREGKIDHKTAAKIIELHQTERVHVRLLKKGDK